MEGYTCKDINGNEINKFVFGDDGVVYGLVNANGTNTSYEGTTIPYSGDGDLVNVSSECCSTMNFNFDSDSGKCYHKEITQRPDDMKIVFNVDEVNGVVFTKSETEDCGLTLKFDYLIEYDSKVLFDKFSEDNTNVVDILKQLTLSLGIEVVENRDVNDGEYYETNQTLRKIVDEEFYGAISMNEVTGVILSGDFVDVVNNKLKSELGSLYSNGITDSQWLTVELIITNPSLIDEINNKEVKFSVQVNNYGCDFSIIMDNISLKKVCDKNEVEVRAISHAPSFNLEKVIDNKKSWVITSQDRDYDLEIRETDYEVDDDRLIINSKEMDLSTSPSRAIDYDVVEFIMDNQTLLSGVQGKEPYMAIDLTELITDDIDSVDNDKILKTLQNSLIDVKSRKVMTSYPTLDLVYDRYLNSDEYGLSSNKYTYDIVDKFTNLLGNHWVELIEQVVPSTTLWGSTKIVSNSIFRDNKFKYKRYNLLFCNKNNDWSVATKNELSVKINTVGDDENTYETCDNVYIQTLNDRCETIGSVKIIGDNQIS
jgi:hypothetical protein